MKKNLKKIVPFFIVDFYKNFIKNSVDNKEKDLLKGNSVSQDLDIYWTEDMAHQLENWGKEHTWIEIECLLINCKGKVLDIACGTGVNIKSLKKFPFLEVYGFDISDLLLTKALNKGINPNFLSQADATKTHYNDNEFDYSYSIGSLEHFTEEGIELFLKECSRYTTIGSFHMIPVAHDNKNHGWIKRGQSYFNNSIEWWLSRFQNNFSTIYIINSGWKDEGVSIGKWFLCYK